MKHYLSIAALVLLCTACTKSAPVEQQTNELPAKNTIEQEQPQYEEEEKADEEPQETQQKMEAMDIKGSGSEEKRTAELYATITCAIADPTFWESFWDDEGENNPEEDILKIYTQAGFANEAEAEAALKKHVQSGSFEATFLEYIAAKCSAVISPEMGKMVLEESRKGEM